MDDDKNSKPKDPYLNADIDKIEKSWGSLGHVDAFRSKLSGGSDLQKRLASMKRKPLPPIRRGLR